MNNLQLPLMRFVLLSLMNHHQRIIVGANGEVFTLGWKAVQELAGLRLVDQPITAGRYRINDNQTMDIKTTLKLTSPFSIIIWTEPILGILAVYTYQEGSYYFWEPERRGS